MLTLLEDRLSDQYGNTPDPFIQSVAVNYLLTVVYADIENCIHGVLIDFGTEKTDARVSSFVEGSIRKVVRSIKCSELAGALGMFDDDCKKHFQKGVKETQAATAYDRIIVGRHDQAHRLGSDLTLADVGRDLEACETVLTAFAASLHCSCGH